MAPKKPNARPRSAPRKSCWISAEFCGASAPAAMPCARRAATSMPSFCAAPAAALHTTKPASAARNIRLRPTASPRRPAGTSASPKVSAYPETTHWIAAGDAPRLSRMDGSATATMLTSSRLMNPAVSVTERARQRRGSGVSSARSRRRPCPGCSLPPCPADRTSPTRSIIEVRLPFPPVGHAVDGAGESGLAGSSGHVRFVPGGTRDRTAAPRRRPVRRAAADRPGRRGHLRRRRPRGRARPDRQRALRRGRALHRRGVRRLVEPRRAVPLPARGRPGHRRLGQGRGRHEGRRPAQARDPAAPGLRRPRRRRRDQAGRDAGVRRRPARA